MKHHLSRHHGLLILVMSLTALPAWPSDDCDAPVDSWQSREAVRQLAVRQGWQIQRMKIDDGCYELRGTDAQGRSFKAKIDPATLKVLKMKPEGHVGEREHARDRASASSSAQPPMPPPASPPGTALRGRSE